MAEFCPNTGYDGECAIRVLNGPPKDRHPRCIGQRHRRTTGETTACSRVDQKEIRPDTFSGLLTRIASVFTATSMLTNPTRSAK